MNFVKKQVQSEKKDIDSLQNTIVIGEDVLRGITKERTWGKKHKLYTHVFYNAVKTVNMTMKKMIKALQKLRIQYINGHRTLYPVTKEQKEIFEAFGLKAPV